jgi:NTE family protein
MSGHAAAPVAEFLPGDAARPLETGIALCLSGGGYRAMFFHAGALWRLAELGLLSGRDHRGHLRDGAGPGLGRLERVSSVSAGSIVSGLLALHWDALRVDEPGLADRFRSLVVTAARRIARITLAGGGWSGLLTMLGHVILPGSVNRRLADAYARHLYGDATLASIPARPRFVINAANLQSGALWRFMSPYMRDWRVGEIRNTRLVSLARAVAASSAFPPFLAPASFEFADTDYTPNSGGAGDDDLQRPPFTTHVELVDGGVYDNLGLETAYKRYRTLLVSNGGAPFPFVERVPRDWARLGRRAIEVLDNQVRSLRARLLVAAFGRRDRYGAYWDIDQDVAVHQATGALPCPRVRTAVLAAIDSDFSAKDETTQERLINWGYAVCDAAVRGHLDRELPAPSGFPYAGGVG